MADTSLSLSNPAGMFQTLYDKRSLIVYNTANKLLAKVKRDEKFQGKNKVIEAITSWGGGVGAGTIPETSVWDDQNATLTRKKLYSRVILDREAMKASKNGIGAFEDATKRRVKKGVDDFMRNMSRTLFALENGKLFEGDNSTTVTGAGTTGSPYLVVGLASTWVQSFIEKHDKVNVGSETTILEITDVNYTTRQVSLVGTSATLAAAVAGTSATSAKIYMQGSKDADPQSILGACAATTGTLYGLDVEARWQAFQKSAASGALSTDLMAEVIAGVEFQCGQPPDLIVTSFKQERKLQNLLGDKLRYCVDQPPNPLFRKAAFQFSGIEFGSSKGPIMVISDRMCPDNSMLFLNTDEITTYSAGPAQWADEDNSVFMRLAGSDSYDARYCWYGEHFVNPNAQGYLYSLA
jgi:hypothetical protein